VYCDNRGSGCQAPQKDYGPDPFVINIADAAMQNKNYRTALWTGRYLQLTLMSIPVGGEIGLEVHPNTDQFIRIEAGNGMVRMGSSRDCVELRSPVRGGYAVFVPAGTWHNIVNTGCRPLKIYTVYAPPHHPRGTVHTTKAEADRQEH
jgi:mannose-6-phosphate isomerase-like protein (cupin superfamily)